MVIAIMHICKPSSLPIRADRPITEHHLGYLPPVGLIVCFLEFTISSSHSTSFKFDIPAHTSLALIGYVVLRGRLTGLVVANPMLENHLFHRKSCYCF